MRVPLWLLIHVLTLTCAGVDSAEPHPHWIWGAESGSISAPIHLERDFNIAANVTAATLQYAPISAALQIRLDGELIAIAEPYAAIERVDLATRIGPGNHRISIEGQAVDGPPGCFLRLELRLAGGSSETIVSDGSWTAADGGKAEDLGPVDDRLLVPASRRVGVDVVDNYEQWRQALGADSGADPASFQLAPGFTIRLVRSALPGEDSWVSMAFDPQGRVIIAKEQQGLLRMTLSADGNDVIAAETLAEELQECRGLAFVGNDLYANANNSKGLYRLRGDALGDQPQLVYGSSGGVGHGRNDLAVGSDGMLYSIHGDSVDLPTEALDRTSPLRDARRGVKTSEGHLLRIDPQSGRAEVLAAGLRNPFGIDFHPDGELFTYDADAEYDMGAPWYRPTRVNHLVTGGDYGWRGVTQSWPPYYPDHPDNALAGLDIGKGSPTAVKFGTRSNFPPTYRDALFVLDWAYGRILAVHLLPRGSSYLMAAETFLKGRPLNVTDLDFAPGGSMYLVTGGRQTQSALYRVVFSQAAEARQEPAAVLEQSSGQYARQSRQLRRELESWLSPQPDPASLSAAWQHLSSSDPWIRHAAINVIEQHPLESWQSRALSEQQIGPAIEVLTSLSRAGRGELVPAIVRRLNELLPSAEQPADKLKAFYAYWLCLRSTVAMEPALHEATTGLLRQEYPQQTELGPSFAHNRLLSELLVQLEAADAVRRTIELLNSSSAQEEQMHFLYVLRNVREGWSPQDRDAYFAGLSRAQHYLGGAGMSDFLDRIRAEAVATLDPFERQRLGGLIDGQAPAEETVRSGPRQVVRQWTVDQLWDEAADLWQQADPARGAGVFAAAACIQCHRFGSRGTLIGPDLTSARGRYSRRDLLVAMLEPSSVIAENYRSLQIVTLDGKTYTGQATLGGDYRSQMLRLATDPAQPLRTIEVPKTEIESQRWSDVSWMPSGLLDSFTSAEIVDLVSYLESAPR